LSRKRDATENENKDLQMENDKEFISLISEIETKAPEPLGFIKPVDTPKVEKDIVGRQYITTRWHSKEKHQCCLCVFNTLNIETMQNHLEQHEPQPEPLSVLILDHQGKPIQK
jgi:hypothetical protein